MYKPRNGGYSMFSMLQCLIIYVVVCGLLTLVCWLPFHVIPWLGYILSALPMAAVVCYNRGFMTAFLVLAIISCITMIPYILVMITDFIKTFIPASAEIIFTVIQMFHVPAEPSWQRILLGISLCCVFFAANGVFVFYEIKYDLNHLH